MSEPTMVGIPIGGAVTDQQHRPTPDAARDAARPTSRDPHTIEQPAREASDVPRATDPLAGTELPGDSLPSPAQASEAGLASPAGASLAKLPASGPIFHAIGEPGQATVPSAALVAPGSHVEVGIQGRARASAEAPAQADGAGSEVRHAGRALAFASVVAVLIGSGFLIRALTLTDPVPPPLPPAWAGHAVGPVGHRAAPLGYARPTRVTVGRVGIHADVLAVGLAQNGEVGVPPTREPLKAAWYDRGPAPGQAGPAVITGHVDSRFAPGNRAAFYELGAVRPGDDVEVARTDRRVAVFRVDSVALVPKTGFPTREVYGSTGYAALRLITCGGHYDRRTGYADNVIVYAHLVGTR
ncbi:class F sortase [Catenulispora rubra]|uniref:class F sortase n=1 Tax=Catenulispora rubra TaxID=280293 RepID=UPI0018923DB8|nr:class F sortase [Catenulispora rubra]